MSLLKSRSATNRKNAAKSTGPKSAAGKQAVALNGLAHGMRSIKPVIPWLESEEDWIAHRNCFIAQIDPLGALEMALAERISLGYWRLGRLVESEPLILHAVREKRRWRAIGNALVSGNLRRVGESAADAYLRLRSERDEKSAVAKLWTAMLEGPAKALVDPSQADRLINSIFHGDTWNRVGEDFNETFDWPPQRISNLRPMVNWLAEQQFDEPDQALSELAAQVRQDASAAEQALARIDDEANQAADLALIECDAVDKMLRYETTIHRTLQKDLHELQRLQGMRKGLPFAPPLAIDVTMDS